MNHARYAFVTALDLINTDLVDLALDDGAIVPVMRCMIRLGAVGVWDRHKKIIAFRPCDFIKAADLVRLDQTHIEMVHVYDTVLSGDQTVKWRIEPTFVP